MVELMDDIFDSYIYLDWDFSDSESLYCMDEDEFELYNFDGFEIVQHLYTNIIY